MYDERLSFPTAQVKLDARGVTGPLETWRHSLGHGGINWRPLPENVVEGVRQLRPRLIRIFIQEFFDVYPGGRFDWSRLDPYMDALARTGAKVMAAITIKPRALWPKVDAALWRPEDVKGWQHVVGQLARRYSVERPIVTHWEIGNEVDIGEDGGCPYLIQDPEHYGEYYALTIAPILAAFPGAKVGGPANAGLRNQPLPGFLKYCRRTGAQLDFLSWHLYHSDPSMHADQTGMARLLVEELLGRPCELAVTEWNRRLGERISVEDLAFDPRRAAVVAASIIAMLNARLDWSFYYHIWDQVCSAEDFRPFFSERGVANMLRHWNQVPHRLGLFGVSGEVRPQYFVYKLLGQLGPERLAARSDDGDLKVLAGRSEQGVSALLVNYSLEERSDRVAVFSLSNLAPGAKRLTVWRIDRTVGWANSPTQLPDECRHVGQSAHVRRVGQQAHAQAAGSQGFDGNTVEGGCATAPSRGRVRPPYGLELPCLEQREVFTDKEFEFHVLLPSDSVALVTLA